MAESIEDLQLKRRQAREAADSTAQWLCEQASIWQDSAGNAGAMLSGLCAYVNLIGDEIDAVNSAAFKKVVDDEIERMVAEGPYPSGRRSHDLR